MKKYLKGLCTSFTRWMVEPNFSLLDTFIACTLAITIGGILGFTVAVLAVSVTQYIGHKLGWRVTNVNEEDE